MQVFQDNPKLGFAIAKMELKPDDVLVVRCNGIVPATTVGKIEAYFKARLPDAKLVVIDKSMELAVLSKQEAVEAGIDGGVA